MRIRLLGATTLALLLGASPAAVASPDTTWNLRAHAATEATHTASSPPRAAAELALAGDLTHQRAPLLFVADDTGMAIWASVLPTATADGDLRLSAGNIVPGAALLGTTARGQARILELGLAGILGRDNILSMGAVDLAYQRDWHLRPTLSRRRDVWRRPYSRQELGLGIHGFQLYTRSSRYGLLAFDIRSGFTEVHDQSAGGPREDHHIDLAVFTMSRARAGDAPAFELDALAVHVSGVDSATDAVLGGVDFVRMRGVRLAGEVYADLAAGIGGTGSLTLGGEAPGSDPTAPGSEPGSGRTIVTENLPLLQTAVGHGRLHGHRGPFHAAIEASRALYLTYDMELALEERLSGRIDRRGSTNTVALEAFAARTHLWLDRDTQQSALTGGASASWSRRLGEHLDLDMSVEVAQSFYASLDGDAAPRAELAVRGTTRMSGRFGSAR